MASSKHGEFRHESIQDKESIIKYLQALGDGIRQGYLSFRDGEGEIVLEPLDLLNLEVKAKRSDKKTRLSIKLTWQENGVEPARPDLEIENQE